MSKLCKDIDERVGEFLNRPLTGEWPLSLAGRHLPEGAPGRSHRAAIIAVAANTEGRREIIGLGIGPSEAETFWTEFPAIPEGPRPWRDPAGDQPSAAKRSIGPFCVPPRPIPASRPLSPGPLSSGSWRQRRCGARAGRRWLLVPDCLFNDRMVGFSAVTLESFLEDWCCTGRPPSHRRAARTPS